MTDQPSRVTLLLRGWQQGDASAGADLATAVYAQILEVSPTTVKREWASARAWLFAAMETPGGG